MSRLALTVTAVVALGVTACTGPLPHESQWRTSATVSASSPSTLLPHAERVALPNGAVLQIAVKDDVPLVALTASVRGGAVTDAPGQAGLAALTARLLEKGAGGRDARSFATAVADVGGELGSAAGLEATQISGDFLAEDAALMIDLALDMLMAPAFDEQEFERARTRAIESIRAARDGDPRSLIGRYGSAFLFGEHPYGTPASGTETSLASLTRDDVVAYHRAHFGPERLVLTVVGDIEPTAVRAQIEARLGDWRAAGVALPAVPAATRSPGRRVLLVDKPDATQTYFWMGNVGIARNDAREASVDVANTLFGGRFTSMLNTALRIESGLTYGARSRLVRPSQPGSVAIVSFTATDDTGAAMDLALEVLDRFRDDPVEDAMLTSAKTYIRGQNPLGFETAAQIAGQWNSLAFYKRGRDVIDGYDAAVAAVDLATLAETVRDVYPERDDLVTVVIGNASAIRDTVARYGVVSEMSIKTPAFQP